MTTDGDAQSTKDKKVQCADCEHWEWQYDDPRSRTRDVLSVGKCQNPKAKKYHMHTPENHSCTEGDPL